MTLGGIVDYAVVRDDAAQPRLTVPILYSKETIEIC
jgi:hypothetical protein